MEQWVFKGKKLKIDYFFLGEGGGDIVFFSFQAIRACLRPPSIFVAALG
jgi:hypothetical protein